MNALYFYKGKRISNSLQAKGVGATVFQVGERILAERGDQHQTRLLAIDGQRSVLGDSKNSEEESTAYPPYGGCRGRAVSFGLLTYIGERCDSFTECFILGNGLRIYSWRLRRFLSSDVLSPFKAGGINSYMYCAGDPVNFSDPSGLVGESVATSVHQPKTLFHFAIKQRYSNLKLKTYREMPPQENPQLWRSRQMALLKDAHVRRGIHPYTGLPWGNETASNRAHYFSASAAAIAETLDLQLNKLQALWESGDFNRDYRFEFIQLVEGKGVMHYHRELAAKALDSALSYGISGFSTSNLKALSEAAQSIRREAAYVMRRYELGNYSELDTIYARESEAIPVRSFNERWW